MITYSQACDQTNREFIMLDDNGEDRLGRMRTPLVARRNGKTKTWATRLGEFRIPIKIGLSGYGEITHTNAKQWRVK